jgi:DNA gyrase/topoisomerase IV subunit B
MYVGPTDHHGIYCLIQNMCHVLLEKAQADEKQKLFIELRADQSIEIQASHRPNVFAQIENKEQLDQLFSTFPYDLWHPIARLATVSALSSDFRIKLQTSEGVISTSFCAGELAEQEQEQLAELQAPEAVLSIRFWPDSTILYGWENYNGQVLCEKLKQLIVWNRVPISYRDPNLEAAVLLHYPDGVRSVLAEQLGKQADKQGMLLYCSSNSPTIQAEVAIY